MNQSEKELILSDVEHRIGMIKSFYKEEEGADELINSYEEYLKTGISHTEVKLFLEDLNLFLEGCKRN